VIILPEKSRKRDNENPGPPCRGETGGGVVATPGNGTKSVVSIRMDRRTLEGLVEYSRAIGEKPSTVARCFVVEGLENAGMRMSSDELHELTRLRMREETYSARNAINKVVRVGDMRELQSPRRDLEYWMSRPPEERVAAVDFLRKQHRGSAAGLQRVARVIQRA